MGPVLPRRRGCDGEAESNRCHSGASGSQGCLELAGDEVPECEDAGSELEPGGHTNSDTAPLSGKNEDVKDDQESQLKIDLAAGKAFADRFAGHQDHGDDSRQDARRSTSAAAPHHVDHDDESSRADSMVKDRRGAERQEGQRDEGDRGEGRIGESQTADRGGGVQRLRGVQHRSHTVPVDPEVDRGGNDEHPRHRDDEGSNRRPQHGQGSAGPGDVGVIVVQRHGFSTMSAASSHCSSRSDIRSSRSLAFICKSARAW